MPPLANNTLNAAQRAPTAVSHTHYCIVGDVTVDASAAIAPGVVLQALPGSRIIIGGNACLAGGVCVQSKAGLLTISPGATLGANVLIVGKGQVGANACISPGSTLIDPKIEDNALLPPNTLLGETPQNRSHQDGFSQNGFNQNNSSQNGFSQNNSSQSSVGQNIANQELPKNTFVEPGPVEPKPVQIPTIEVSASSASYDSSKNGVQLNQKYDLSSGDGQQSSALTTPSHDRVYGRHQVSELISTLFPNRQSLNGN